MLATLVIACEASPPTGQTIARVDGTDVTEREVDQELRSAGVALASAGPEMRGAAMERIVQRKILASEALSRDLDREGDYHFALRQARDELLVRALQRRLRYEAARPDEADIAREIAKRPWVYRQREFVTLSGPTGAGEQGEVEIDTADAPPGVGEALVEARVGDDVTIEGRVWNVISKKSVTTDDRALIDRARKALVDRSVDAELTRLIDEYRQAGQVQYQEGKGASAQSTD